MQHYRNITAPIEEIQNHVRVLMQLAHGEICQLHPLEAIDILRKAAEIAVYPRDAKNIAYMIQDCEDQALLMGLKPPQLISQQATAAHQYTPL